MADYTITVTGRGGHGSRPDLSVNPIDCFAAIHTALSHLEGYRVHRIDGGTSGNIIPNSVIAMCSCEADRALICKIVENTCLPYRCTGKVE